MDLSTQLSGGRAIKPYSQSLTLQKRDTGTNPPPHTLGRIKDSREILDDKKQVNKAEHEPETELGMHC